MEVVSFVAVLTCTWICLICACSLSRIAFLKREARCVMPPIKRTATTEVLSMRIRTSRYENLLLKRAARRPQGCCESFSLFWMRLCFPFSDGAGAQNCGPFACSKKATGLCRMVRFPRYRVASDPRTIGRCIATASATSLLGHALNVRRQNPGWWASGPL